MKLAVFGGSFNPVHKGHIFIAEEVHRRLGYGIIVMIPAWISPFKQNTPPDETRREEASKRLFALLEAVEGRRYITVDDCELLREGVSWTIDTIEDVILRYRPREKPGLILGDDLAAGFHKWKDADRLSEICDLILASRSTEDGAVLPFPFIKLNNNLVDISSSMVREKTAQGADVSSFAPRAESETPMEAVVRAALPAGRFIHSRNTAIIASRLARRFGLDEDAAYLAGITHDIAKEKAGALSHGPVGAKMLLEQYGITNDEVIEAVRVHTEGAAVMRPLAKIVYIADKIEWRRKTVSPRLRDVSGTLPLDELFLVVKKDVHEYLIKKGIVPAKI